MGGDGTGIDKLTDPANTSPNEGDSASFTCNVTAMAGALAPMFAWGWQFSASTGAPSWADTGVADASLSLSPVTTSMAGLYRCTVTATGFINDARSSVTYTSGSAELMVTMTSPPPPPMLPPATVSVPALEPAALALLALLLAGGASMRRVQ